MNTSRKPQAMHQTHLILSSLNLLTISVFDLATFSISCRKVGGEDGRGREVGGEGGLGSQERRRTRGRTREEGERKGMEEDSKYGAYNMIQMLDLKMLLGRIESLLYCLAHTYVY